MGVSLIEDEGFSIEMVRVEYEWKPPRCDLCKIFGHVNDQCPKKVTVTPNVEKTNDGFQMVANKKKNGKAKSISSGKFGGQSVKQSSRVSSMPKVQLLKAKVPPVSSRSPNVDKGGNIIVSNSYDALDDKSEEEVENVFDESANLLNSSKTGVSSSTYIVANG
ncbi:zinc knuckle CX2CX4HX4C containing protein [Tanacetum coccineum]